MRNCHLRINDERWLVEFVPQDELGSKYGGECNYNNQTMLISKDLDRKASIEVVLHEILHAHLECLAESAVEKIAESMANALYDTGLVSESGGKGAKKVQPKKKTS